MRALMTAAAIALALPAFAEGDPATGEKVFSKCKACHKVETPEGDVIMKGGKTGPNLYGIIGRVAGSTDFRHKKGLKDAMEANFVWTEEALAEYVKDPKAWLKDNGFTPQSSMSLKLRKGGEDVAAYLASVGPAPTAEASE